MHNIGLDPTSSRAVTKIILSGGRSDKLAMGWSAARGDNRMSQPMAGKAGGVQHDDWLDGLGQSDAACQRASMLGMWLDLN